MRMSKFYQYIIFLVMLIIVSITVYYIYFIKTNESKKDKLTNVIKNKGKNLDKYIQVNVPVKKMKKFEILEISTRKSISTDNFKSTSLNNVKIDFNYGISSVADAERLYYTAITKNTINCSKTTRIGRQDDGGWDVCFTGNFNLKPSDCLSYSFGVNYIWEFDDQISSNYKCRVRTFDPSMLNEPNELQRSSGVMFYKIGLGGQDTRWSNGWNIMKMSSILKKFNEENKIIDILKIDIEYSEWESFEGMLKDNILSKVKQIMFETHTEEVQGRTTTKENFIRFLKIWNSLYEIGFRQWKNNWNHFGNYRSRHTGDQRTCCYEHYLINIHFL